MLRITIGCTRSTACGGLQWKIKSPYSVIRSVIRLRFRSHSNPRCERAKLILFQGAICRRPSCSRPGSFASAIKTLRNCICNLCCAGSRVLFSRKWMAEFDLNDRSLRRFGRSALSDYCSPLRGHRHNYVSGARKCCRVSPKSRWLHSVSDRLCYLRSVRLLTRVHGLACQVVRSRRYRSRVRPKKRIG